MRSIKTYILWSVLLLIIIALLFSCNKEKTIVRGFYYWKTNVNLSDYEKSKLDSLSVQNMYVRFFDVDIAADQTTINPIAIANFSDNMPKQSIIPVVFITPRALNAMKRTTLVKYANKIASLIEEKCKQLNINPLEVQIDCDWTATNKELYFEFLNQLQSHAFIKNKLLSATIRLYQVKYKLKTGIPPVTKGLLMVYNIGDIQSFNEENSIITKNEALQYLDKLQSYPLDLDIAMPIYSWVLIFENEKLKGIARDLKIEDLSNKSIFTKKDNNRFLILHDTLYRGYNLKKNQVLKYENSDLKTLTIVGNFIAKNIKNDSLNILLYHCDSATLNQFSTNEMEKIYTSFK